MGRLKKQSKAGGFRGRVRTESNLNLMDSDDAPVLASELRIHRGNIKVAVTTPGTRLTLILILTSS